MIQAMPVDTRSYWPTLHCGRLTDPCVKRCCDRVPAAVVQLPVSDFHELDSPFLCGTVQLETFGRAGQGLQFRVLVLLFCF